MSGPTELRVELMKNAPRLQDLAKSLITLTLPASSMTVTANTKFFPRAVPDRNYPDPGATQGSPSLTASDKANSRKVFMQGANDDFNACTTGGDHPSPLGVMNDSHLLPNKPALPHGHQQLSALATPASSP
jgi:hypothetical protein